MIIILRDSFEISGDRTSCMLAEVQDGASRYFFHVNVAMDAYKLSILYPL